MKFNWLDSLGPTIDRETGSVIIGNTQEGHVHA